MPDHTPQPWENGWTADASRTPGTRRLWLAGALALAAVAVCVTAIALQGEDPKSEAVPATNGAPTAAGPGLLSFASPSTHTSAPSKGSSAMTSMTPETTTASASAGPHPASAPSKSSTNKGSSPIPEPPKEAGTSVQSVNYPDRYWHISGDFVRLDSVTSPGNRQAATFTVVKGLANSGCYSFATADGGYLRHRSFLLRDEPDDGTPLFRQDATFCPRPSAYPGATMLESVNYPGRFLRHQNFQLKLAPYENTDLYRADSAFLLVDGLG
ncbi:AbfB domain-containing protein [Streptomyces sp. NPDC020192]|uniref:AbfB domain-containing protein n=1 Tax=Streptomyces sp. NPDC020192 TaxID=3365066 RepID=UPI0037BB933F